MEVSLWAVGKDCLVFFVYPLIVFLVKKMTKAYSKIEQIQNNHNVRLSVTEAQVKAINDDIKEIKNSIDKLPERIKADIKDILKYGK